MDFEEKIEVDDFEENFTEEPVLQIQENEPKTFYRRGVSQVYLKPGIPVILLTQTGLHRIAIDLRENSPIPSSSRSRNLFKNQENIPEPVEDAILSRVIYNLNLAKQEGVRFPDQENLNIVVHIFKQEDVVLPGPEDSKTLFWILLKVFEDEINCKYFTEEEIDSIYETFTLSKEAKALLTEILKKPLAWHRFKSSEASGVQELIAKGFFNADSKSSNLSDWLNLLQDDELQNLCKSLKVGIRLKKRENIINKILEYQSSFELSSTVLKNLGLCVRLPESTKSLFDRIFTLLMPIQNAAEGNPELFEMINKVLKKEIEFFSARTFGYSPFLESRENLIRFVEAKTALKQSMVELKQNNLEAVKNIACLAFDRLFQYEELQDTKLPLYSQKFLPQYVWMETLSESLKAYKEPVDNNRAIEMLEMLITNYKYLGRRFLGLWYNDLSQRLQNRTGDWDASGNLLQLAILHDGITNNLLSVVDYFDLISQAEGLVKKHKHISQEVKKSLRTVLDTAEKLENNPIAKKTISGPNSLNSSVNLNLEEIASRYYVEDGLYRSINGGSHFIVALFTTFFWDELFDPTVLGVFVSFFQKAPLDLYTDEFLSHIRGPRINQKLNIISTHSENSFANFMAETYERIRKYESEMVKDVFENGHMLKEIVLLLGKKVVLAICQKMLSDFELWKSGFPELLFWNPITQQYKFVKVQATTNSLSKKEELWLRYLSKFNIKAEACFVKRNGRRSC